MPGINIASEYVELGGSGGVELHDHPADLHVELFLAGGWLGCDNSNVDLCTRQCARQGGVVHGLEQSSW